MTTPRFDIAAQVARLGSASLLPPYKPTPGEMRALKALTGGSLGYWQWRAACVTYNRPHNQRFRRAWAEKLSGLGLIKIEDGTVSLTAAGKQLTGMSPAGRQRHEGGRMSGLEMKYFVLKPRGDDAYAKASRAAMRKYALMIREENPDLSDELREWADREQPDFEGMSPAGRQR